MPFRRMRRRRRSSMNITQSNKVQFAIPVTYIGGGANNNDVVSLGVAIGTDPVLVTNTPVGAKIFRVHVGVSFVSADNNVTGIWSFMLIKLRKGQTVADEFATINASQWSNIGNSSARNQVIASYTGIVASNDAMALNFGKSIKIPDIYQRTREGDQLILVFTADLAGTLQTSFRYKYFQ